MADSHAYTHTPVLLAQVIDGLQPQTDGIYVDCTFGRGGHSRALLACLGAHARVLAIDKDAQAVEAGCTLAAEDSRVTIAHANFDRLAAVAAEHQVTGLVNGVLFDLGLSSPQLDDAARGFGFQNDGPLDMRMDVHAGETAAEWLNRASAEDIALVIRNYGEERYAKRIARAIVASRANRPLETTRQLADIVSAAQPRSGARRHPATRTFQAIRIHINGELAALDSALEQVPDVLAAEGRLAVISFH